VVYRTDAAVSRRARVLYEVPEEEGPAISYALAALKGRPERARARRLAECLTGPRGRTVFRDLGFIVPEGPP
jgi:molybdate transport system substrate-binding protein